MGGETSCRRYYLSWACNRGRARVRVLIAKRERRSQRRPEQRLPYTSIARFYSTCAVKPWDFCHDEFVGGAHLT